ncbi:MAG: efflux RND transporter periplasmic adaptor subunit [Phycisphaerae bacterium]
MTDETTTPGEGGVPPPAAPASAPPSDALRLLSLAVRLLLVLVILALGAGVALYWLTHQPKARRKRPQAQARLVEVTSVRPGRETVVVRAMGAVAPARSIHLAPRVGGEIVEISPEFVPGGRFDEGRTIARIDPEDYRLALARQKAEASRLAALAEQATATAAQRETEVTQVKSQLDIEMGRQSVAKREYELLGETVNGRDEALILRRPQLEAAKAALEAAQAAHRSARAAAESARAASEAAQAAVRQAELDLARTRLRAPFNAVVQQRQVNLGSQVAAGAPVATLVGTDTYWVCVSVPVDQLPWIRIPRSAGEAGAPVRIYNEAAWGPETHRTGRVLRLESTLEEQGRMARLLVSVPDPLGQEDASGKTPPLLIGSYVRAEIEGTALDDVIALDRDHLRNGNQVWVMNGRDELEIRSVEIAHRGRERVLVSGGLTPGEKVVTTDLTAPAPGMPLRTEPATATSPAGSAEAAPLAASPHADADAAGPNGEARAR